MSSKATKVLKGASWLLAMSLYSRILGMLSVLILARYLSIDDFGIIAGCFVAQGFFTVLSNMGSSNYLIRKEIISKEDLNAAFTLSLSTKFLIMLLIYLSSDFVADYMKISELADILKVMSIASLFIGLQNPEINVKVKKLQYKQIFKIETIAKTVSSSVSIFIVIFYQSYWAIVYAEVIFQLLYLIGTYWISAFTPRLSFSNLSEQWGFSKWLLLKGWLNFFKGYFDKVIVSRQFSLTELGLYNFAMETSGFVTQLIIAPINKVFYPSLADDINNKEILGRKMNKCIFVLFCFYMPVVFGGVYFSEQIIVIFFGDKWIAAAPMFELFLIMTISRTFMGIYTDVFTLIGEVKALYFYELFTAIMFVSIMYIAASYSLQYFALTRVIVSAFILLWLFFVLSKYLPLNPLRLSLALAPIAILSIMMWMFLNMTTHYVLPVNGLFSLIVNIALGATAYVVMLVVSLLLFRRKVDEYAFTFDTFVLPLTTKFLKKEDR